LVAEADPEAFREGAALGDRGTSGNLA
jgi:hypothetical protein